MQFVVYGVFLFRLSGSVLVKLIAFMSCKLPASVVTTFSPRRLIECCNKCVHKTSIFPLEFSCGCVLIAVVFDTALNVMGNMLPSIHLSLLIFSPPRVWSHHKHVLTFRELFLIITIVWHYSCFTRKHTPGANRESNFIVARQLAASVHCPLCLAFPVDFSAQIGHDSPPFSSDVSYTRVAHVCEPETLKLNFSCSHPKSLHFLFVYVLSDMLCVCRFIPSRMLSGTFAFVRTCDPRFRFSEQICVSSAHMWYLYENGL